MPFIWKALVYKSKKSKKKRKKKNKKEEKEKNEMDGAPRSLGATTVFAQITSTLEFFLLCVSARGKFCLRWIFVLVRT
jgi:hypothetical protein